MAKNKKAKAAKAEDKQERSTRPPLRLWIKVAFGIIAACAAVSLALAAYTVAYQHKIYPHTFIGSLNLGGQTTSQAQQTLDEKIKQFPGELAITVDDKTTQVKTQDLELKYDAAATADQLFTVGRVGSVTDNLRQLLASLFSGNHSRAVYSLNDEKTAQKLGDVAKTFGSQAADAKVTLNDDNSVAVTDAKPGVGVALDTLTSLVRDQIAIFEPTVSTSSGPIDPKITADQAAYAATQVKAILAKAPLTVSVNDVKNTVSPKDVFGWITYSLQEQPTVAPSPTTTGSPTPAASPVSWLAQHTHAKGPLVLIATVNQDRIKDFMTSLATTVNHEAQNAELTTDNGQIKVSKDSVDGLKLNVDAATKVVADTLNNPATSANQTIALPSDKVAATIKSDNIASLGIKELIAHGETDFKGSPSNRVHNITVGVGFLNGAIVAPGQTFSTIATLGKIDDTTGYLPELVIKENRTTPEFGGGLCQVSTTLFRSVLNAGLKVTARQNHSYRVSYYEPPVGLDATIYFPKPDFAFLNDTPGYILIQGQVKGTKVIFDLYGTKDDRSSSVTDPIVSDVTDPPAPIYDNTDTLNKGETKQVEKPHQGATAVVTYTVTRGGQEINKQTFRSKYKAWPARFLVGTKEG